MKNKLIILCLLILLLLTGCSTSKVTENGTVNATSRIAYSVSEDKIKVSNVIIKCNDSYYGVTVNDSINYNSNNNYFITGSGLTVMITSDKLKTGSTTKDDIYTAVSKIEDNAYLYVSGKDVDKVNEIFNNVFKTNKLSYTFLAHDINDDWTKEVNITEDIISFSNGEDTIYAYQNDGSLSEGCINGRIEPTVFKKALRGIDIPITYPEDTNDEWDYIPYGVKEYEHLTIDGYTPYSAYQTTEYETEMVGSIETRTAITKDEMANYILLAKDDQDILSLFNDKNEHTQTLYSLSIPSGNTDTLDITSDINLSNMKALASSIINSENRYHFGVLTQNDEDGYYSYTGFVCNADGSVNEYEINQKNYYNDHKQVSCYVGNIEYDYSHYTTIPNTMLGRVVIPTIRASIVEYGDGVNFSESSTIEASFNSLSSKVSCLNKINECLQPYDYDGYFTRSDHWDRHGEEGSINNYLLGIADEGGDNFHFINEGDYVYEITSKGNFRIYRFTRTYSTYSNTNGYEYDEGLTTSLIDSQSYLNLTEERYLSTCSRAGYNGFTEYAKNVGSFSYKR